MKALEVLKTVVDTQSMKIVRQRKGSPGKYDVNDYQGRKRGWVIIDLFSAGVALQVYECLSEKNKCTFEEMDVVTMIDMAFKCCAGGKK